MEKRGYDTVGVSGMTLVFLLALRCEFINRTECVFSSLTPLENISPLTTDPPP